MSGGVDSAVALLRSLPNAVGVTLRLWLDPDGPDSERACCSPESVIAARETCHRLGVPHVTLDLREEFRRAVVTPFVRGYARGETPNPCTRCNGGFRFAELLAFAAPRRRRAAGDRPLRAHRRARRPAAARARRRSGEGSELHARRRSTRGSSRASAFPLGEQDKEATRAEAERAGLAAAPAPESQEACFLAGDDYRAFLGRHGLDAAAGRDRRRGRERARPPRRLLALHARPAPRPRARGRRAALRPRHAARPRTPSSSGRASRSPAREVTARGRLYADAERVEAKLRYRSPAVAARVESTAARLPARARRAGVRRRAGPGGGALRRRRRRRIRADHARRTKIGAQDAGRGIHLGDLWRLALAVFLFAVGISLAFFFVRLAGTVAGFPR